MRIKTSKSKTSLSFSIIKSIYFEGKHSTKIVESLGSMTSLKKNLNTDEEGVYKWMQLHLDEVNQKYKLESQSVILKLQPNKLITKDHQSLFNGGYLFLQDIFYDLKLNKICDQISKKHNFDFDLTAILSRLIYTRMLYPSSKLSSYEASKLFIEKPNFEIHQIYRALDIIEKETDFIQSEVYKNSINVTERNTNILYYDCTNYFFEINQEKGIKKYGFSKEHRPIPIVQMGLFMDGNGIPLAFCINPGSQNEQVSLIPLEKQIIKDFELSNFIICTDAGLGSTENRIFNNFKNRSYIITQSLKMLKKHLIDWSLDNDGWNLYGSSDIINLTNIDHSSHNKNVYYKSRWINENGLEQMLIVSFSPVYENYQKNIRQAQIDRAQKHIDKNTNMDKKKINDPKRLIDIKNTTKNGEIACEQHLELNKKLIDKVAKFDGFYAVCTTLDDSVEDIVSVNKRRWEIEESFRIMKTEFKSRPIYLQKDNRIKVHFTTCFLALLFYRILEKKLEEKYSVKDIITTLKDMNFIKVEGDGFIPTYQRTNLTDDLHEKFEFRTDTQIVINKEIKKIINKTKK